VEEVFNGCYTTLCKATGLSGCERRIQYHCTFLKQTGAWDQLVSILGETKDFQVRGIIKQCFQERFPYHIWYVQEQLALKGHHVFPSRIMLYARQLGLTINQTRNVANTSGPERCKERLDVAKAMKVKTDLFYEDWCENKEERCYYHEQSSFNQTKLCSDKVPTVPGLVIYDEKRLHSATQSVTHFI
jgi:hypothetical protein